MACSLGLRHFGPRLDACSRVPQAHNRGRRCREGEGWAVSTAWHQRLPGTTGSSKSRLSQNMLNMTCKSESPPKPASVIASARALASSHPGLLSFVPCHDTSFKPRSFIEPLKNWSRLRTGCIFRKQIMLLQKRSRSECLFTKVQSNQLISLSWQYALLLPFCVRNISSPATNMGTPRESSRIAMKLRT